MWVPLVVEACVIAVVVVLVFRQFASFSKHPWWVPVFGIPGFFFAFSMVFLLPLDISSGIYDKCLLNNGERSAESDCEKPITYVTDSTLIIMWRVIYWASYSMCWTVYPFLISYSVMGGFTFWERARRTMVENIFLYSCAGLILLMMLIYIAAANEIKGKDIAGIAIAAANAWGLLLCVLFMGFGLVEIPRQLWLRSSHYRLMNSYRAKLVERNDDLQNAEKDFDATLKLVKKISDEIPTEDDWRPYIDKIISECPEQYEDIDYGDGDLDASYENLIKLSKLVKTSKTSLYRCQALYTEQLYMTLELVDVIETGKRGCSEWRIKWTHARRPTNRVLLWLKLPFFEWLWRVWLEVWLFRLLTLVALLLSTTLLWSEVTMPSYLDADPNKKGSEGEGIDLSVWSHIIHYEGLNDLSRQILCFIPLCYLAACVYWSLFRFRLFNFYRLIPHQQSDPGSMIFAALYLGRLTSPLAYNFLNVIHNRTSAFYELMGDMTFIPIIGGSLNTYLPIALALVALATLGNLFSRLSSLCNLRRFDFGSDEGSREEADAIMHKERVRLAREEQKGPLPVTEPPSFISQPRRNAVELMEMEKGRVVVLNDDKGKTIVRDKPGERDRVYLAAPKRHRGHGESLDDDDDDFGSKPVEPRFGRGVSSPQFERRSSIMMGGDRGDKDIGVGMGSLRGRDRPPVTGLPSNSGLGRLDPPVRTTSGGASINNNMSTSLPRDTGAAPTNQGAAASGGGLTSRLFTIFGGRAAADTSLNDYVDDIDVAASRVSRARSTMDPGAPWGQ